MPTVPSREGQAHGVRVRAAVRYLRDVRVRVRGVHAVTGADYLACVRLSGADDVTLAVPGETCERVPASSLPGLLASGKIVPAPTVQQSAGDEEN